MSYQSKVERNWKNKVNIFRLYFIVLLKKKNLLQFIVLLNKIHMIFKYRKYTENVRIFIFI